MINKLLVINKLDNVATALDNLNPGVTEILGDTMEFNNIIVKNEIRSGHKVSLCDIEIAAPIIKFGVVIGFANKFIKKGDWVHLHNVKSRFDERSGSLDSDTGAPTDTLYI